MGNLEEDASEGKVKESKENSLVTRRPSNGSAKYCIDRLNRLTKTGRFA